MEINKSDSCEYTVIVQCFTYNHEKYIKDALNGFVMQKTNFKFCVLVVDDFSTDKTTEIIKSYEEKYPEIIKGIYLESNYYSQKKSKRPILLPWFEKCKYVAVCEGDDYWIDPLKLQKQVDVMESDKDRMFCGSNAIILHMGKKQRVQLFNDIKDSHELTPKEIIGNWLLPTPSLMFKREVIVNRPNWCDKVYSGDLTLVLLGMYSGKGFISSDISCVYRRDESNYSSSTYMAHKRSHEFITEQHVILYEEFNNYTNGKYAEIINPLLKSLNSTIPVYKVMNCSYILAFLRNPIVFVRIAIKKYKREKGLSAFRTI